MARENNKENTNNFYGIRGYQFDNGGYNIISRLIALMAEHTGNYITKDCELQDLLKECLLDEDFDLYEKSFYVYDFNPEKGKKVLIKQLKKYVKLKRSEWKTP